MGIWGAGVLESDGSRDAYDECLRLFGEGKSPAAVLRALKRDHLDARDADDRAAFWPAVALAQWECGQIAPETLRALKQVIERGDGMDAWRAEDAALARKR